MVGLRALAGHAHHQHEVHEAVGGVAGRVQAVQGHLGAGSPRCRRWRSTRRPCGRTPGRGRAGRTGAGPPSSSERWPVPMIATRWSLGHDSTSSRMVRPSCDEPLRLRQRRREDVGVDRHDRQVGLRPQRDDRAGDAVVDPQLVAERQVEAGVQAVAQDVRGQVLLAAQRHPRQAELALLVVPVGVVERRLADQELRHVVQPQLVEVVAADHHQHVGPGPGQRLAERLDLGAPTRRRTAVGPRRWRCWRGSRTGGASRR